MANKTLRIEITHAKAPTAMLPWPTLRGLATMDFPAIADVLNAIAAGLLHATVDVALNETAAARASGTATFVSVGAGDILTIDGVDFTCVASGATGNQFNVGANDTATAANCAAAINASTTAKVSGYVRATSSGAVVTITAIQSGNAGNMFTLAETSSTITVSGAFLTGGAGGDVVVTSYSKL
jgi:phage tail sheath gpL-like